MMPTPPSSNSATGMPEKLPGLQATIVNLRKTLPGLANCIVTPGNEQARCLEPLKYPPKDQLPRPSSSGDTRDMPFQDVKYLGSMIEEKDGGREDLMRRGQQGELFYRRLSANAVEDLLECPVCNERFNRPKMLPCQHTFCAKCLRDQITYSRGRVNNFLQCPLCQLQVKLKIRFVEELEGALDSLPSNLYIDSLLAVLQNESPQQQQQPVQEPEVRCSKCQTVCSARICNHCKQNFCGVCWPSHMTELRAQLGELLEQLKGAKDRLEHRAEDFKCSVKLVCKSWSLITRTYLQALCEKLREHIDSAVGQRLEELRAEQARLQEEAGQVVEAAERSASQLMERLGEAEENVTTGGGFDSTVDDNQKVRMTPRDMTCVCPRAATSVEDSGSIPGGGRALTKMW
uniref:RING-type domain-containing protein n=2 Tax=Timema TaxID=61471 RepID=A0A7R9FXH7_TIMSH|nr:unnamed protein product [Timema shepardi]